MSAGKLLAISVPTYFLTFFLPFLPPAQAQEGALTQAGVPRFALSATHQDEISPRANGPMSSMPWVSSSLGAGPAMMPMQGRTAESRPIAALPMIPPPTASEDRPNSYMEEYQVSWSPWIQNLANRWHRILKDSEELLGVEFQTARPALIQFTCYADGRIGNVVLRQSSGVPVYDKMQILSLMEAAPLEPFPPGTQKRSITLIQGWESHLKQPGEQEFNSRAFANKYPLEKVNRWISKQ